MSGLERSSVHGGTRHASPLRKNARTVCIALAILGGVLIASRPTGNAQDANPAVPQFLEETRSSGLESRYDGDWEFMVGGGVATFDCNDDALPDAFLAGGTNPARLYLNSSEVGGTLKFRAFESGLEVKDATGAYPLDVDGDGRMDLMVLRVGENVIYRGLGGCRFERANQAWGFDGGDAWSTAFAATWERGATWPTLAVGNYIDRTKTEFPWGSCTPNWLHRPNPNGTGFGAPVALKPSYCALSMLFTDWNRSGRPALRISNDREYYKGGQEQLWKMTSSPRPYTQAEGWKPLKLWGMGIASFDLTGDGYPDYYLTSMADQKLQVLEAGPKKPSYADVAFRRGLTAQRPYVGDATFPSTGWHAQFEDVNNDGWMDLFIAKGNVAVMPDFAIEDPNNLLLGRADGTFIEAGDRAGVASTRRGRGAIVVDFNLDGLLDLIVVNRWDEAQVWRNTSSTPGHWAQFRLRQSGANRDAIGAWLEVRLGERVIRREITVGGGHASGHQGWIHVGLGDALTARVRVRWPDGKIGAWEGLESDRFYLLERGEGARAWVPGER